MLTSREWGRTIEMPAEVRLRAEALLAAIAR